MIQSKVREDYLKFQRYNNRLKRNWSMLNNVRVESLQPTLSFDRLRHPESTDDIYSREKTTFYSRRRHLFP